MRLKFEQLEQRLALSGISFTIDGPEFAYIGEAVEYQVVVTNQDDFNPAEGQVLGLSFVSGTPSSPDRTWRLDDIQYRLDDVPWDNAGDGIAFGPGETRVFTAAGTVPDGVEAFQFVAGLARPSGPAVRAYQTIVLDTFVNGDAIGTEIIPIWSHPHLAIYDLPRGGWESLETVQTAGDLNGDGFGDVYLITTSPIDFMVEGERMQSLQRFRHTYHGTEYSLKLVPDESLLLWTSPPFEVNSRPPWSDWPEEWQPEAGDLTLGDVDGDGFEDQVVCAPGRIGTATIFFGPDNKENFVFFGSDMLDLALPTNPGRFGCGAGALGDVNGDGFADFYVGYRNFGEYLYILHGRDFGRDLPADIDRNGTVDFADFLVLAYNYGNENVTRSEGDLDGDGVVAFSDFIVLRDTFGQSKVASLRSVQSIES